MSPVADPVGSHFLVVCTPVVRFVIKGCVRRREKVVYSLVLQNVNTVLIFVVLHVILKVNAQISLVKLRYVSVM